MTKADPLQVGDFQPETIDDSEDLTQIQEFYKDTNIFITGATGFLGNILLEKLLRSCRQLSTIYIMVRNKKGKNPSTRVEEIFDGVVFEKLKKMYPKFRHKVVGIVGDCSLPDLGISLEDRKLLTEKVNIVFHVAATVRFDEQLKSAVAINVKSSQEMLKLAQEMPNLKSYIHVSTAYSNCIRKVIEEKLYPPAMDFEKLMTMTETMSNEQLEQLTPKLLDEYPNTYTFTKQIAECVVGDMAKGIPVGITRPSIVISSYKEPIPAWINNMYGPSGVVAGAGVGLLRVLHGDKHSNANLVPVDMCVNSMIAAAWDVNERFTEAKNIGKNMEVPIYNFDTTSKCPITWKYYMENSERTGLDIPSAKAVWYYSFQMQKNAILFYILSFLLHTLPAFLVDAALICMGKKTRMLKVYTKIHKLTYVLSYFATQSWTFKSENVQRVCDKMSERDKQIFFFDLKQLDWEDFFKCYMRGVRVYIMDDPMDNIKEARKRWRKLYWAHQITKTVIGFLFLRILWYIFSLFYNIFF